MEVSFNFGGFRESGPRFPGMLHHFTSTPPPPPPPLESQITMNVEKCGINLCDIRRAVRCSNIAAETDDDEISKENVLFKGKVDVCLKSAAFPFVRRLRKVHCEYSGGIMSSADQLHTTR